MCPPTRRQKNTNKHFFLEVDSEEDFIKNIRMHTPEQLIYEAHEHEPPPLRRNRRAIGRQLSSELLLRYQLFVERRHQEEIAEAVAQEREHHQEEIAEVIAQEREHHQEELAEVVAQEREHHQEELDQAVAQAVAEAVAQERERSRQQILEILQIERLIRSSDTPINIREQLRRRHEELCALLNILDTN